MKELSARVKEDNRDPRVACAILLDTSSSMDGEPIKALNEGYELFRQEIKEDHLAAKRTEVLVVTFGGTARVEIPFTEGRDLPQRSFKARGTTPMGAALDLALNEINTQKEAYKRNGLEYFRPWLFVITDGEPTDNEVFDEAVERVRSAEKAKGVTVFAVGVGEAADMAQLARLSSRQPARLRGLSFQPLFAWLSASMSTVSQYRPSSGDPAVSESEHQRSLPPPDWLRVD